MVFILFADHLKPGGGYLIKQCGVFFKVFGDFSRSFFMPPESVCIS